MLVRLKDISAAWTSLAEEYRTLDRTVNINIRRKLWEVFRIEQSRTTGDSSQTFWMNDTIRWRKIPMGKPNVRAQGKVGRASLLNEHTITEFAGSYILQCQNAQDINSVHFL